MRPIQLVEELQVLPLIDLDRNQQLDVLAIRNEPEVRNNMYTNHVIQEAEHFAWIERLKRDRTTVMCAVLLDNKVIGGKSTTNISLVNHRADWAFYLTAAVQGKGIGSALEFKTLDFEFDVSRFLKLNCEVLEFNTAVIKLHKKFGFVEEGIRRNHIIRDGKPINTHLLGITRDEWVEARARLVAGAFSY